MSELSITTVTDLASEGAPDPFGDLDEAWRRAFLQATLPRPSRAMTLSGPPK